MDSNPHGQLGVPGSVHRSEAQGDQVATPRMRRETGTTCMMGAQDMVSAAGAQVQAFDRREDQQSWESTSVGDIVAKSHPSSGLALWGAGTSTSALASGSASARDTPDTVGHQRWSASVAHAEGTVGAALILRWRAVLRAIEGMPC